ncbi:MAG: WD40 repeat domain-containing protein [Armatimonadota bacterium]
MQISKISQLLTISIFIITCICYISISDSTGKVSPASSKPILTLGERWWAPTVRSLAFSPDGTILASMTEEDGLLRLWDLSKGKALYALKLDRRYRQHFVFSRDGKMLAASTGGRVDIYDVNTGNYRQRLSKLNGQVLTLAFTANGNLLAVTSEITQDVQPIPILRLWKLRQDEWSEVLTIPGNETEPPDVTISHNCRYMAVSRGDGILQVWDLQSNQRLWQRSYTNTLLGPVVFSPDDNVLAVGAVEVRYVDTGEVTTMGVVRSDVHLLSSSNGTVEKSLALSKRNSLRTLSLVFPPNKKILAIGNQLWDIETGKPRHIIKQEIVTSNAFSRNGKLLALGSGNGKIRLWDVNSGKMVIILVGGVQDFDWLMFTSEYYYTGSESMMQRIRWDIDGELCLPEPYIGKYHRQDIVRETLRKYQ